MILFYDYILAFIAPFVKFWSKLHFPFSHKKITGKHYYMFRDKIKVGTVLLTKTRGEFSNLINPTEHKHAGIYVGDIFGTGVYYVLEAVREGVRLTDLVTFLTTKDVVVASFPTFIREDKDFFEKALQNFAKTYVGTPYDYLFRKGATAFYCFELVAAAFISVYSELRLQCKEIVKGKRIYDGNTFLDKDFFIVLFDSRIDKDEQ